MIKVERIEVSGVANALHGMRHPLESYHKADSDCLVYDYNLGVVREIHINDVTSDHKVISVSVGENDDKLAKTLILAGTDHGKWLRQIQFSADITAPMTFWWDFDTYRVATVKNSTSRMHKLGSRELAPEDFSWDDLKGELRVTSHRMSDLAHINALINRRKEIMQKIKEKDFSEYTIDVLQNELEETYREMINDLPDSYNFTSTWTGSYQTLRSYYFARKNHKQKELRDLCKIIEQLPHGDFITVEKEKGSN